MQELILNYIIKIFNFWRCNTLIIIEFRNSLSVPKIPGFFFKNEVVGLLFSLGAGCFEGKFKLY